jgi:hypothetical protein
MTARRDYSERLKRLREVVDQRIAAFDASNRRRISSFRKVAGLR